MDKLINPDVITDFREERSGIPNLLCQLGCRVKVTNLKAGDYIINDRIVVERKRILCFH